MTPDPDYRKRFGGHLRALRRGRKFSQEKLGMLMGGELGLDHPIRRNEIIRYEQGLRYPRPEYRLALARALGVSLASLEDDDAPPAPPTEGQDPAV